MLLSSISQPIFGYYSDKISKPWFVPLRPILCSASLLCWELRTITGSSSSAPCSAASARLFITQAARMVNKISGPLKASHGKLFRRRQRRLCRPGPSSPASAPIPSTLRLVIFGLINFIICRTDLSFHAEGTPSGSDMISPEASPSERRKAQRLALVQMTYRRHLRHPFHRLLLSVIPLSYLLDSRHCRLRRPKAALPCPYYSLWA